jgi:hypothetical protein
MGMAAQASCPFGGDFLNTGRGDAAPGFLRQSFQLMPPLAVMRPAAS